VGKVEKSLCQHYVLASLQLGHKQCLCLGVGSHGSETNTGEILHGAQDWDARRDNAECHWEMLEPLTILLQMMSSHQ
jgi:hypothetical protein